MTKTGRPPFAWTEEIEEEILGRLMMGEALVNILSKDRDDHLPGESTFYARLANDSQLQERYARAHVAQAHREVAEIKAIADEATAENVHVARLRIDARKWRAAKMAPKVYGERLAVGGADDMPAVRVSVVERLIVKPKAEDDPDE